MIRKAKITDAKVMQGLIHSWAKKGKVLERSLNFVYENIRDFWIFESNKKVVGCCAFHVVGWQGLGEIKSLVVLKGHEGKGIGGKLVKRCIKEARVLGLAKVFALTFVPVFFKKLGFSSIDRKELPHKVWSDCVNCIDFPDCCEEAVIYTLIRRK